MLFFAMNSKSLPDLISQGCHIDKIVERLAEFIIYNLLNTTVDRVTLCRSKSFITSTVYL